MIKAEALGARTRERCESRGRETIRLFCFLPQNLKETQIDFLAKYCTLLEAVEKATRIIFHLNVRKDN